MGANGRPLSARTASSTSAVAAAHVDETKTESKPAANTGEAASPPAEPAAVVPDAAPVQAAATQAAPLLAEITQVIESWATAWSKKEVKAYLAFYAKDFVTPGNSKRGEWETQRANRINKPGSIQVTFENLRLSGEGTDRAVAKFRQHYRSASIKTSSNKVLVLVKRDGKWLIQQERVGS
jgi:ketosteroid isomerase-like protein